MKARLGILAWTFLGGIVAFTSVVHADSIYTFDNLTAGTLSGQDNWKSLGGTVNVVSSSSGGYYASSQVAGNYVSRINDSHWSFVNTASSGSMTLLMDAESAVGNWSMFGLTSSGNSTTYNSPIFGLGGGTCKSFMVRGSADSGYATYAISSVFPTTVGYVDGDWLQLKLSLTIASDNSISGTLYARDLTRNQSDWTTVVSNHSFGTYATAANWDTMWLRLDSSAVDNLTIASVPEPSALAMLGVGLVSLLIRAWRRRK